MNQHYQEREELQSTLTRTIALLFLQPHHKITTMQFISRLWTLELAAILKGDQGDESDELFDLYHDDLKRDTLQVQLSTFKV